MPFSSFWRSVFVFSLLFLASGNLDPLPADTADAPTRVIPDAQEVHPGILCFTVSSAYQPQSNKLEVLLPDDYSPKKKQYRVVYLLPVNVGTDGQWGSGIVEAQRDNLQNAFDLIFVAPAYGNVPWFGDNPTRKDLRQNSYLIDVVIPFIEHQYSTDKSAHGRLLVGFSKAGLGAWELFLMHLDLFEQAGIFDSYQGQPSDLEWKTWGFLDTYGTRENFDRYEPTHLLDLHKKELAAQPRRITLLGGGPGSRVGVDLYRSLLREDKIPFIYVDGNYMQHDWYSGWLPLAVAGMVFPGDTSPKKP
jgi:hypothetical protein